MQSRTCENCSHWEPVEHESGMKLNGHCHYWPPINSKETGKTLEVETESQRAYEIKEMIESHGNYIDNLRKLNSQAFKTGKSFDEIKAIQKELEIAEEKAAKLKNELSSEKRYVMSEKIISYKRGVWPLTASDDWCGQWSEA